ncbi:hypothetical protein K456DRAFT_1807760, partial [Colletotrichum gloeosporioides 23]
FMAKVFSVILSAVWGTLEIKFTRDLGGSNSLEGNEWTFGQVISVALLSSSLIPIFELFYK